VEKGSRRTSLSRADRLALRADEAYTGILVAVGESYALVPVRVSRLRVADGVGFGDVFFGEVLADGAEVLAELFFIAGAHDDVGCGGTLQEPVERDLQSGLARFFRDFFDGVYDSK
jgi:hypothetical protein